MGRGGNHRRSVAVSAPAWGRWPGPVSPVGPPYVPGGYACTGAVPCLAALVVPALVVPAVVVPALVATLATGGVGLGVWLAGGRGASPSPTGGTGAVALVWPSAPGVTRRLRVSGR
jgi:hypothetical protein